MPQYFDEDVEIESNPKVVCYRFLDQEYEFITDRGVFSYEKIDKGTRVLLETFAEKYIGPKPETIADVGCGYGVISCVLAEKFPSSTVLATDTNNRARKLANENALKNVGENRVKVLSPNEIEESTKVDLIVSNPPVRIGKEAMHELIKEWTTRLAPQGQMWLVIAKNLGGDSTASYIENVLKMKVTRVASKKGFRVLRCAHRGA